jgi:hypothetical protein
MTSVRQRLAGRIQVDLPPGEAFRLFTPRGEEGWAVGAHRPDVSRISRAG